MTYKEIIQIVSGNRSSLRNKITTNVDTMFKIGLRIDKSLFETLDKHIAFIKTEMFKYITILQSKHNFGKALIYIDDFELLERITSLMPDFSFVIVVEPSKYTEAKNLMTKNLAISKVKIATNVAKEMYNNLEFLFTVNMDISPEDKNYIDKKNIFYKKIEIYNVGEIGSIKEQPVDVDASGWGYNSSNGMYSKYWGNDGSQTIKSWGDNDWSNGEAKID